MLIGKEWPHGAQYNIKMNHYYFKQESNQTYSSADIYQLQLHCISGPYTYIA